LQLDERDILTLVLAVLDREPEAHRILADLLEETGQPGAAQFARAKKSKLQKRIDFTLTAIPARMAIGLGCQFLAKECRQIYRKYGEAVKLLDQIQNWTSDEQSGDINSLLEMLFRVRVTHRQRMEVLTSGQLERDAASAEGYYRWTRPESVWQLAAAIRELIQREEKLQKRMWFNDQTAMHIRRVAEMCFVRDLSGRNWQLDLIRQRIEERLNSIGQ